MCHFLLLNLLNTFAYYFNPDVMENISSLKLKAKGQMDGRVGNSWHLFQSVAHRRVCLLPRGRYNVHRAVMHVVFSAPRFLIFFFLPLIALASVQGAVLSTKRGIMLPN